LQEFRRIPPGRSTIVKKEAARGTCGVRLSCWIGLKEYQESQSVCGIKLPGLKLASQLPEPIFTPATKAEQGHDENIDMKRCAQNLAMKSRIA
jgi:phosphoribosylaminoimidazole-succinocarboxamide synthase